MNLMTNVSILFADIAGFTKMASNKVRVRISVFLGMGLGLTF